jgi:hypothetical protein
MATQERSIKKSGLPTRQPVQILPTLPAQPFRLDGGILKFEDAGGTPGVVDANEIDWLGTAQMTSAARSTVIASVPRAHQASEGSNYYRVV